MSHNWNIIIVKKRGFPREPQKEFQVSSKSLYGAAIKALNKIKQHYEGWNIKSIWWLDPQRPVRNIS